MSEWISVETLPEESGDYLCAMVDGRDDYDDEWFEVVEFKVSKAFTSRWMICNFDEVTCWMKIPALPEIGIGNPHWKK